MSFPIRWTARAAGQLAAAAEYLEIEASGAGLRFVDIVEDVLEVARDFPRLFPVVPGVEGDEVRRALVGKFGYWAIYEIRDDAIVVLSLWHGARHPDRWRDG